MEKISHQNQKPSLLKRLIPIVIILAVVFVLLQVMGSMKTEPAKVPEKAQGFLVETATLQPTDLTIEVQSQGMLQPKRQIALLTEVSGKVMALNPAFTAGGLFKTGEVLVQLDPADYRVAVSRAEANLASAQAQLDLEQAKSDQAKKDWQSFGKQGTPSDLLLNLPQLDGAKASLKAAKADLMKAKRDLEKTEIKAPFDGTVISKAVDLGQFVGMSGQLGTIAGTAVGEVRLSLSNHDLAKLNINNQALANQPLEVTFIGDESEQTVKGHIKRLEASKDSRTLMNYAVAEIAEPFAANLLFNSFLQAHITGPEYRDVFAIPTAWMMPNNQISVYEKGGKLAIKTVQVAHKTNDYFYVNDGLSATDHIISTPIQAPEVGMQLRRSENVAQSQAKADEVLP